MNLALRNYTVFGAKINADAPAPRIDKKKVVQKSAFFFANSLSFDLNFETTTSEYMPHHSFYLETPA